MKDFKQFMNEHNLGASAQDAIGVIKGLNGKLTARQWDQLIILIKKFAAKSVDDEDTHVGVGWNLAGATYGVPDQVPVRNPATVPM
jgi:hypothetical protein